MVYPKGTVSGKVVDETGAGIEGITVTFYDMTAGEVQETLTTDENGEWSSTDVYLGHTYRIWYYHTDYEIAGNGQEYEIGEEPVGAAAVTAVKKDSVAETGAEDFTCTFLNGTYCRITGYTGEAAEVRIPAEIDGHIVQSLGDEVFSGNTVLTTVVFRRASRASAPDCSRGV